MGITSALRSMSHSGGGNRETDATRTMLGARIGARLGGWRLDHELARGMPSGSSPALAARAERLRSSPQRAALAASIEAILAEADRDPSHRARAASSRAPLNVKAIRAARRELETLAAELRSDPTCQPRGIARCRLLLGDCAGPLYGRSGVRELELAVRRARTSLHLGGSA